MSTSDAWALSKPTVTTGLAKTSTVRFCAETTEVTVSLGEATRLWLCTPSCSPRVAQIGNVTHEAYGPYGSVPPTLAGSAADTSPHIRSCDELSGTPRARRVTS